jgi:hypothetical protein
MILWWLACATDTCDDMCDAALSRFEACMAEDGDTWGDTVYAGPDDYAEWCATWSWEQRRLDETDVCDENLETFETGDCDAYDDVWSSR